jgi:hypothetical protein
MEAPSGMILKQIKDFQEQYGYKLRGILLALKYFHETLGNPARDGDGIGIVVYVYEEAKKHYITKMKVEESLDNLETQRHAKKIEVVSPKFSYRKTLKEIDISSL